MGDVITLDLADGVYDMDVPWRGMVRENEAALCAAAFPVKPPVRWFGDPGLKALTPLTIDNTGQVYGHIAAWHTSHIGLAGGVRPPKSKSGYAFYRTGVVEADDGTMVPVGQITLAGGHASLDVDVARAVAHYDDTNSAIMDVSAGEDRHGIWVAGALRPSVTDEQIRSIRASSVSGDWRPINGRLELVAVCAVNCPGFPIPRARVAAGTPIALVAAGVEPLVDLAVQDRVDEGIAAGLHMFRERVKRVEDALIADAYADPAHCADLRKRVHKTPMHADASPDNLDTLRARVHMAPPPGMAEAIDVVPIEAAGLRARVKAPMIAAIRNRVRAPMIASLRVRVHEGAQDPVPFGNSLTAGVIKKFVEALHPRGGDGKFIEKGGFVSGLFHLGDGSTRKLNRVEVHEITDSGNKAGDNNIPAGKVVIIGKADSPDLPPGPIWADPKDVTQIAGPKANVDVGSFGLARGPWEADFEKVTQALETGGWVKSIPDPSSPDGVFQHIDPAAPDQLVRLYKRLLQIGYANGFMASAITAAALRARVHDDDETLLARGDTFSGRRLGKALKDLTKGWDEALHPRGNDGTFIEKNGNVSGVFQTQDGSRVHIDRAKILGFRSEGASAHDPFVLVEGKDRNGKNIKAVALASEVTSAASPKAHFDSNRGPLFRPPDPSAGPVPKHSFREGKNQLGTMGPSQLTKILNDPDLKAYWGKQTGLDQAGLEQLLRELVTRRGPRDRGRPKKQRSTPVQVDPFMTSLFPRLKASGEDAPEPVTAGLWKKAASSIRSAWDEALHPRGHDGTFIDKHGSVSAGAGAFKEIDDSGKISEAFDKVGRATVIGFATDKNKPGDPWVLASISTGGKTYKGVAHASDLTPIAETKAHLDRLLEDTGRPRMNDNSWDPNWSGARKLDDASVRKILKADLAQFKAEQPKVDAYHKKVHSYSTPHPEDVAGAKADKDNWAYWIKRLDDLLASKDDLSNLAELKTAEDWLKRHVHAKKP